MMLSNPIHTSYMDIALKEATKAMQKGEVPVGAVITNDQGIVAKARNRVEEKQNSCFHAELLVINAACKKLNTKFLNECILYVTLEPCEMCIQAIHTVGIRKLFFGASITPYTKNLINSSQKPLAIYNGLLEKESQDLMNKFFTNLRNRQSLL